uniref:Uncharacterized protein n=1 Tax=Leptobrachium leishanense TaxID=445787 RepID=A0A8C5Q337_9ANUR
MASADLRDELTCSICLNIYRDPVTLPCGHSFCRLCIAGVLNAQEEYGAYTCPECRAESQERPALEKNRKLGNISAEHVLTEPTTSLENWKCSVHREILKYYCCEDAACICVSCSLAGEHRGHQVETLNEASEKKKEKLRNILQKLTSQREEAEKSVQNLEELRRQVQGKATGVTEEVTALIRDIREQLEALEKRVLSEISRQEEQVSLRVSDLIRQLEIKEELTRKMGDIEELCDMTDPVTVLQEKESDRDDYCDAEEDKVRHDIKVQYVDHLDMGLISTAGDRLSVSGDLKMVSDRGKDQRNPEALERFQDPQVLSSRSFSSGRHYWEVERNGSGRWMVGMTYPSIARKGDHSRIGKNNKSWALEISRKWFFQSVSVIHDSTETRIRHISCQRLGIYLDYEAGRLSFYELCDPIRHLHTFTAAFTEPLHAVFEVCDSWVRVL